MDGDAQERDVLRCLDVMDWTGLRSPASGTAPRAQPDILVAKEGTILVGELKSGDPPRNPTAGEVDDLQSVAFAFGGAAAVIARFKRDRTFYLAPPEALSRTPDGNYSIPGDPSRFPWTAKIEYTIDHPTDGDVEYHAVAVQQDVPDRAPLSDPLRRWTTNVAQAQITGCATDLFGDVDPDADADAGGDA